MKPSLFKKIVSSCSRLFINIICKLSPFYIWMTPKWPYQLYIGWGTWILIFSSDGIYLTILIGWGRPACCWWQIQNHVLRMHCVQYTVLTYVHPTQPEAAHKPVWGGVKINTHPHNAEEMRESYNGYRVSAVSCFHCKLLSEHRLCVRKKQKVKKNFFPFLHKSNSFFHHSILSGHLLIYVQN